MTTPAPAPRRDFDTAWRAAATRYRDLFDLLLVAVRRTEAGARPIPADNVADELGTTVAGLRRIVGTVAPAGLPSARVRLADGYLHFELVSHDDPPRFLYRIGGRRIPVGGCAGDPFLFAYGLNQPFTVEATCPTTGRPIRVEFTVGGVSAQPAQTVLALIHPDTAPEAVASADPHRIDTDICLHQPFFASAKSGADWLAGHPGGQLLPVDDTTYHHFADLLGARRYLDTGAIRRGSQ
jgi:alkylmercury lyase